MAIMAHTKDKHSLLKLLEVYSTFIGKLETRLSGTMIMTSFGNNDFGLGGLGLELSLTCMPLTDLTLQLQSAALLHNDLSRCWLVHDLNIWRSCN